MILLMQKERDIAYYMQEIGRLFVFGEYSYSANICIRRIFVFGEYSYLANIRQIRRIFGEYLANIRIRRILKIGIRENTSTNVRLAQMSDWFKYRISTNVQ